MTRFLSGGERLVASVGLPTSAVLVAVMIASTWWTLRTSQREQQRSRVEQVGVVTGMLTRSAEVMLGESGVEDLTALRRMFSDAAANYKLTRCRLTLADGKTVVADASPNQVTMDSAKRASLPAKWAGTVEAGPDPAPDALERRAVVDIRGRGQALLEVSAADEFPLWASSEVQLGIAAIGVAGMVGLLASYRVLRARLRGLAAIREALRAAAEGDNSGTSLMLDSSLGPEAGAWNTLLEERESLRQGSLAQRATDRLASRPEQGSDLSSACDALWQGLLVVDDGMKVRYSNGAAGVFLGVKREDAIGKDVLTVIADERVRKAIRDVVSGECRGRVTVEMPTRSEPEAKPALKIDDGTDRRGRSPAGHAGAGVLRFSIRPVRREDSGAAMILIEDVTQQRVADEARNAFVAQATHELRTPLTNMRLYIDQLIEDKTADATARSSALNVVSQEARRLERIIGDMLSVSEIEAGSIKLHAGDIRLGAMFDELKADYAAQAQAKEIRLTFDLPPKMPVIRGDRDKYALAMHNLIGNALKYTPTGGQVAVSLEADERVVRVKVVDNGIGIRAEETEKIFEKFYRAHDKRIASINGTGLGLALAREVARLHGGDVIVQSQVDKGSTFTMTVPLGRAAA